MRAAQIMVAVSALLAGWAGSSAVEAEARSATVVPHERLYSKASPFNTPIDKGAPHDPRSSVMIQSLVAAAKQKGFVIASREWTVPVYYAGPSTPRYDVVIQGKPPGAHYDAGYRHNVERLMRGVPIPRRARPDPQRDGHLTVIDRSSGCEFDLYGAAKTAHGWTAKWGNATSIRGDGIYPRGLSARATGIAPLAGMIWPWELAAGAINHALVFSYPHTKKGGPVAPATASDGKSVAPGAIPQGARLQLDPSLDLSRLGLTRHERIVGRALQRYGMILGDTGGAVSLYAVGAQSFSRDMYAGLLPNAPYAYLKRLPVGRFRVLELGPQRLQTKLELVARRGCSAR